MEAIVKNRIIALINQHGFLNQSVDKILLDEDLTNYGLNSISAIRLTIELEREFEITINDNDLIYDNFKTVQKIYDFVSRKMGIE